MSTFPTGGGGVGPAGAPGPSGAPANPPLSGAGSPSNSFGSDGDLYINTTNADIYQKTSGSWSVIMNMKGPTGLTGATGSTGSTGSVGATGSQGASGNFAILSAAFDGKTAAATKIGTTANAGLRFMPILCFIELLSVATLITACTLSVGSNTTADNNIVAAVLLTGLTSSNLSLPVALIANPSSVAPNTDVFVKVTIGATAGTFNLRCDLLGYYY